MHTVVPGWFGASSVWFIPLIWRLVRSVLPGGAGLRGPGTIRLWLGFVCVLVASSTLEATLIHVHGFNAFGYALGSGLGKLAGHVAAPLAMTALFLVSLPWFLDFRWRGALAWADASLGLGLDIRARSDDDRPSRSERRSRRAVDSDTAPTHGVGGSSALDSQTTLDGSPRRRPTVWRPPETVARAAGAATAGAAASTTAAASGAAKQSVSTWRVEPRLQDTADAASTAARSEPVAPAGWLRPTPAMAARAEAGTASAADSRRQMARAGEPSAAPVTPPLAQSPGGHAPRRAEMARPLMRGGRAATSASALPAAAGAAQSAHAVGTASGTAGAAGRGATAVTVVDPLAPPLTSPFANPLSTRRNAPPPVAGSTAARAAASAPPPRPPKPPRPFVWPTQSARNAMRAQPVASGPSLSTATPAWPRPASTAEPESPAALPTNALDTLRSIEQNTARWTSLAGASLARRTGVDGHPAGVNGTDASADGANRLEPSFLAAAPQPAVAAATARTGTVAAPLAADAAGANVAAVDRGAFETSPAIGASQGARQTHPVDAPFARQPDALTTFDTPQPHGTHHAQTLTPDTTTSFAASPFATHDARPAAVPADTGTATPFTAATREASADEPSARFGAMRRMATGHETAHTTPDTSVRGATPDASPAEVMRHQGTPEPASQNDSVPPQPSWPAIGNGLAPWGLLDGEPQTEVEAPSEPTRADDAVMVFSPAPADTPMPAAPVAVPATNDIDAREAAEQHATAYADADANKPPAMHTATDTDETAEESASALFASQSQMEGANIVRFPRFAHDAQRVTADVLAQQTPSPADTVQRAASAETASGAAWHAAATFAQQATDPAPEETPAVSAAPLATPTPSALAGVPSTQPGGDTTLRASATGIPQTSPALIATAPAVPVPLPDVVHGHGVPTPWQIQPDPAAHAAQVPPSPAAPTAPAAPWEVPPAAAPSAPSYASAATAPAAQSLMSGSTGPAEPAPRQPVRGHAPTGFVFEPLTASAVELPGLDLLDRAASDVEPVSEARLAETGQLIEQRLQEFKVPVTVVGASAGPVITRFEVEPALGVRGSQIVGLMKDLSRGLGLTSIRVVETIPGKTCMGLELPNARRHMIRLSEILESAPWQRSASKLTIALGKDIVGQPVVTDLARAPHMLVAGTTGSGKSVAINAMILSLLYKATPEDVRLIMIDPKMLELSVYEGIPHLLAPVVTDMRLAANALNWCVGEMEKRYRLMSAVGVRNLASFNQKIRDAEAHEKKIGNPFSLTPEAPEPLAPLPMIVVVIDELADLMMVAGKKIEELIARLAQKARASGIHLILATQRPSVDVITGLIKANIPTRVAFQVSSKIDSRTILDQMGAESLLGQGDMLFLPPGTGYPQRVHGAFVADEEVHAVVEYLKQFGEPEYVEGILDGPASEGAPQDLFGDSPDAEADPLYDEAVAFVVRTRRASISSVQRQLRIGYNRAARLVEQMEAAGLVSPMGINGSREVLVPGQAE